MCIIVLKLCLLANKSFMKRDGRSVKNRIPCARRTLYEITVQPLFWIRVTRTRTRSGNSIRSETKLGKKLVFDKGREPGGAEINYYFFRFYLPLYTPVRTNVSFFKCWQSSIVVYIIFHCVFLIMSFSFLETSMISQAVHQGFLINDNSDLLVYWNDYLKKQHGFSISCDDCIHFFTNSYWHTSITEWWE